MVGQEDGLLHSLPRAWGWVSSRSSCQKLDQKLHIHYSASILLDQILSKTANNPGYVIFRKCELKLKTVVLMKQEKHFRGRSAVTKALLAHMASFHSLEEGFFPHKRRQQDRRQAGVTSGVSHREAICRQAVTSAVLDG